MFYVYLLYSDTTEKWYLGSTKNLKRRMTQHNSGLVHSTATGIPWRQMYYEAFVNDHAARIRESKLKAHGKGLAELKKRITIAD